MKKKITEMYLAGRKMTDISDELGVGYQQVTYLVDSRNLKEVKAQVAKHDAEITADAVANARGELVERKRQEIVERRVEAALEHEEWRFEKIKEAKDLLGEDAESNANLRIRLGNAKAIDELARRAFRLDDSSTVSDAQRNVAILLNVNVEGAGEKAVEGKVIEVASTPAPVGGEGLAPVAGD